jgi:hypothetical protein
VVWDLEKLRFVAVNRKFSNKQVEQVFLNLQVENEEEIKEAFAILQRYRPKLLKKMIKDLEGRRG